MTYDEKAEALELFVDVLNVVGAPPPPTLDAPRVFDDQGHQLCPSCGSQLRRGWYCTPCNRVGATAPTLLATP